MKEKLVAIRVKIKKEFIRISIVSLILMLCIYCKTEAFAKETETQTTPGTLYARSGVLMDGSSGRILYEKNGEEFLANASTTKILTCILALENGSLTDVVTVSSYAASMPDVQLHIREGEQYYLEDLLFSLMLESHNDVAVAIAEHISGSQKEFSKLMNQKAKEIGCKNTVFLTPNGLDATQIIGEQEVSHGTTAGDLALIMRYCIRISPQKEEFLRITRTASHKFWDLDKTRRFSCRNHNAFLTMMEGAVSGKTGFTGKAGYCYVGALEREGKCYIVALLACGWPNNKSYKWSDCKKLMNYGLQEYELFRVEWLEDSYQKELKAEVRNAKRSKVNREEELVLKRQENEIKEVLLKKGEKIVTKINKKELEAPLKQGEKAGWISYYIGDEKWMEEELYCDRNVERIDFEWCMLKILEKIIINGKMTEK